MFLRFINIKHIIIVNQKTSLEYAHILGEILTYNNEIYLHNVQ